MLASSSLLSSWYSRLPSFSSWVKCEPTLSYWFWFGFGLLLSYFIGAKAWAEAVAFRYESLKKVARPAILSSFWLYLLRSFFEAVFQLKSIRFRHGLFVVHWTSWLSFAAGFSFFTFPGPDSGTDLINAKNQGNLF